jgi:hypothetical protein
MSDHDVAAKCANQVARLQDEASRIRSGLRELKVEAASQSLHEGNGNAARAAFARFEGHIEQLLAIGAGVLLVLLLAATPAHAQSSAPDCDGSKLAVTGMCVAGGALRVTITNVGSSMQGAVAWEFVVDEKVTSFGSTQLGAQDHATLTSKPAPYKPITFTIRQRPGVEPTSITLTKTCGPNNVALTTLSAQPVSLFAWLAGLVRVS